MPTLLPQFTTHTQNLQIKRGASVNFTFEISNSASTANVLIPGTLNLQDCLVFAEIRRKSPGYKLVEKFLGSVDLASGKINLIPDGKSTNGSESLASLDIFVGDLVTLEGSGIENARIQSVEINSIITEIEVATKAIASGSRLYRKSGCISSFTPLPESATSVILTSPVLEGDDSINVSALSGSIASGKTLSFGYRDKFGWHYVGNVVTSALANSSDTSIPISSLNIASEWTQIPRNAIAFTSASAISKCALLLDSSDTDKLVLGTYSYSVLIRDSLGFITSVLEGEIEIVDNNGDAE